MEDGRIIARKGTTYADSGAYNRHTPYAVTKHAANAAGPYNIPNVAIDAYCVYTNKAPSSAMRGFAVTMSTWAIEQQMDKIAEVVGLDPWAIRFINAYKDALQRYAQFDGRLGVAGFWRFFAVNRMKLAARPPIFAFARMASIAPSCSSAPNTGLDTSRCRTVST